MRFYSDVVAKIVRSTDGGPLRQMTKGGSTKPTGTFVSLKAGNRAMPWESIKCELPALELAEVSTPVVSLLAQPHRLELNVRGRGRSMVYFPDLELTVEPSLFMRLIAAQPFGQAMLQWDPDVRRSHCPRTVVVEIKDDADPRNEDEEYQTKLRLAAHFYQKIGIGFITAIRSRDLACVDLEFVRSLTLDRFAAVTAVDVDRCIQCLGRSVGGGTLGELVQALGGGSLGRAKAIALHVRRIVAVDIGQDLRPSTAVSLLPSVSSPGLFARSEAGNGA